MVPRLKDPASRRQSTEDSSLHIEISDPLKRQRSQRHVPLGWSTCQVRLVGSVPIKLVVGIPLGLNAIMKYGGVPRALG